MSDSFRPKEMLKQIVTSSFNKPVLDIHMYQLFTPEDQALDVRGHLDKAARWQQELEGYRRKVPVIVGEWCAALDEHSNPAFRARTFSDRLVDYERYAVAQQRSFDAANVGWFYWTARTEDGGIWSFLDVAEILPR